MRGVRAVIAAVVLVIGAAGCSAEPEAAPAPSPGASSTSEAPVAEPSPTTEAFTKPALPEAATTPDAAGAEAFVRYWYELVNYAYASGDSSALLNQSHVDCVGCLGAKENVDSATSSGAVWQDMTFAVEQLAVEEPDSDGLSFISGLLTRSPNPTVREPDGTIVPVSGPVVEGLRLWVQWTGEKWQVFAINYPDRAQ